MTLDRKTREELIDAVTAVREEKVLTADTPSELFKLYLHEPHSERDNMALLCTVEVLIDGEWLSFEKITQACTVPQARAMRRAFTKAGYEVRIELVNL